jgi:hypothetical protein
MNLTSSALRVKEIWLAFGMLHVLKDEGMGGDSVGKYQNF